MKKSQRSKGTKAPKKSVRDLKSAPRTLDPRKADQVKGGLAWTKGGGASVG